MEKQNISSREDVLKKGGFREATCSEYLRFISTYCSNPTSRNNIIRKFKVEPYECLDLPTGSKIYSSLKKGDQTCSRIVVIKAIDVVRRINYHVVFPGNLGVQILKKWNMNVPFKNSIIIDNIKKRVSEQENENTELRHLLLYMRAMELGLSCVYQPMNDGLQNIYKALLDNPNKKVDASVLHFVNEILKDIIEKENSYRRIKLSNINDYVMYLHLSQNKIHYIPGDFKTIHHRFVKNYPTEKCYF